MLLNCLSQLSSSLKKKWMIMILDSQSNLKSTPVLGGPRAKTWFRQQQLLEGLIV